ncbi:MAG: BlaI/MecI/CopY family transcriptional regulator [Rudaea sp.]|uniref:BlaI/MecI/CopY family transcriptional regulator n=1 Tax=unclassified Rudaea TaxID=2627037 RepID=UPI0010F7C897|nr:MULTISPECIES: BlaI/MecI/CopY family transcriptional regulator [unclassified Rudaea]MBN8887296.1 BlaI/MecI/CopY family transcriptional regulator [Rudaea sp.]MBR0346418.1 BlaI/MecI/CopY family transcriptional regulator [Rudaea sp.]
MSISDAESVVMDVLWRAAGPLSAEEVVAALADTTDWQEPTIKTLLNRLLKKHAIVAERDGKRYLYSAKLKRTEYVHSESKSLIDRLFGGRVAPLVAHFSEAGKLGKKDLAELKRLIEELDDDA